jgi:putative DNA primase/helicase
MLHGTGANGKSTFVETICDLMGEYALRTQVSTWTASERGEATHEIAALAGARLVASNEAESGSRMAEGIIKQATGGDRMRGCFKYQNSFEFVPAFKLWLALNHKPLVRGTDEGLWRRMRLVPFSVTIPAEERDHTLRARLVAELPGILAWAVRGAFEWYHFGLQEPDAIREATLEYKGDQDTFAEWIDECLSKDERSSTSGSEIYKSFTSWCERQGIKPMANNKLAIMLKDRGFRNKKNRAGRFFWLGIGLVTEGDGGFDPIPNLLYLFPLMGTSGERG